MHNGKLNLKVRINLTFNFSFNSSSLFRHNFRVCSYIELLLQLNSRLSLDTTYKFGARCYVRMKHPPIIELLHPFHGIIGGGTVIKIQGKYLGETNKDIRCIYPKKHPDQQWKILEFVSSNEIICETKSISFSSITSRHGSSYDTVVTVIPK